MNRRRNVTMVKSLKDYIVPIVWLLLIILLIYSVFSGGDSSNSNVQNTIQNENKVPLEVKADNEFTEAYVVYTWANKKLIEDQVSLYKWEGILVKEWSVSINLPSVWNFDLSRLWEFKYGENGDFYLDSSDLWVNSETKTNINLKYASVTAWEKTHLSLSQNEMWSTVYLLSWEVEVRNLAWKSTVLAPGQKITISRLDASNKDVDLTVLKEDIDDFFKKTDWYIKNNGDTYLNMDANSQKTQTGSKLETYKNTNLLTIDTIKDESYVSDNSLEISWTFTDENISKIKLNNNLAKIDTEAKTFNFNNVVLNSKENDLVFKIYDDSNALLQKFVYVVYYTWENVKSWEVEKSWEVVNTPTSEFNVKTYPVDWNQFTFTEPTTSSTFTSDASFITIKWNVTAQWIAKVSVNWYFLSSFNWWSWRYHADTTRNNLKDWTNIYDIKYYDIAWNLVYNNSFTIIRNPKAAEESSTDSSKDTSTGTTDKVL